MAPVHSETQRCSPCKGRSALSRASNLPADGDNDLEPKDLLQKMSQIMDLLEEDVKRSRREVQKLMTEKETAEKAHANAKGAEEDLRKIMERFRATHADTVKCGVCQRCIDRPFTLVDCGHSFCYGCLRKWFHNSLLRQLRWRDTIPAHLKQKPVTVAKLKELFENKHIYTAHYTCPIAGCLTDVENKPIENDLAGNMINTVNDILGSPAKQVDADPHLNEPNVWADIFYDA
ncbi:hypothetical protein BKA82DRAFT_19991 [Pisolithus tinctorius]|uniref:RING-type domain-containing protein n=1 Tax=Pisolithus tinctorius Marx 270 TaxID=870435 RepID=A0A0C3JSK9_PISTI|nr:hypothetical protein BKA82DRAFT_19991 [Pisolithus tinctorius]KIO12143.1 hypothetical protein M404DRAFT_19991 [Pisolithus tinctorius Marx 270]